MIRFVALVWFAGVVVAFGQAGRLDPTFKPVLGGVVGARVFSVGIQPDGKILVSGLFTNVNGVYVAGLVRLNRDGTIDLRFEAHPGNYPRKVSVTPEDKIMIKGSFESVNGIRRYQIARLNGDGSLDVSFDTDFPFNSYANFAFQSDGCILVDGFEGLYRLRPDGSTDPSFVVDLDQWGYIDCIVTLPDDRILISGDFFFVNGVQRNMVAMLKPDGTVDPSFNTAAVAFYNEMTSVLPVAGGKVVAAGSDFARLLSNGNVDASFPFYESGARNERALALQRDGGIIAGGRFVGRDGIYYRTNLSRYLPDGATDPTFDPGLGTTGGNVYIQDVKIQQDQRIIIGGAFTHYDGHPQAYLARVLNDWPVLETKPAGGNAVELSWPAAYTNFVLQSAASITAGTWNDVATAALITNDICYVTNTLSPGNQFFRLVKKP